MIHLWRTIKSIFVNDAHNIISERGKILLAEEIPWLTAKVNVARDLTGW